MERVDGVSAGICDDNTPGHIDVCKSMFVLPRQDVQPPHKKQTCLKSQSLGLL